MVSTSDLTAACAVVVNLHHKLDANQAFEIQRQLSGWIVCHDESGCREQRLVLCGVSPERAAEIVELAAAIPAVREVVIRS